MVKKEQYQSEQQDSYFSQDKYQPDPQYQQSSDEQSEQHIRQVYSQSEDEEKQQNDSQEVQEKMSLLHKQQQRIKQQLKQLPYGLILKQKQQLQIQKNIITKKIRKNHAQKNINTHKNQQNSNKQNIQSTDKHAPKQVSIHKKPHKKVPLIFESSRSKSIDPRFEDYAGHYNQDLAKKTLDFIPKLQEQEIKAIRKTLDQSKATQKNSRNKKKLSQHQRKVLIQQYNKLTNEKRQNQLSQIEKQAKRNVRNQQSNRNNYNNNNYNRDDNNDYQRRNFIQKGRFKEEFEKVKQSKMSDEKRKDYLKNKEKNAYKNQQVDRNNMMYETSSRFKQRQNNNFGK